MDDRQQLDHDDGDAGHERSAARAPRAHLGRAEGNDSREELALRERPTADAPASSSRPSPWPGAGDAPTPEPLAPGAVIADRFRVGRALGRGGHGTVYQAEHVSLGYPVAVKVLHGPFGGDVRRRARFRREALLGARLRHRNVVSILDAGELEDGTPFLVMEHVDGADLESVVTRTRLDAAAVVELGVQLLAGLTALGERGVIHRDIKPSNVMLQRCVDGFVEVKLLDFGISKAMRSEVALETLTADDCVLGTPQYMPPEQVRGEPLDARADLYSVGCVLYECLTGRPPFDAETAGAVLARILTERARPIREVCADVPEHVAAIVERALARDAADRWRHPAEMSEALRSAARALALPQGADAWSVLEREAPLLGTMPLALVRSRGSVPPAGARRARSLAGERTSQRPPLPEPVRASRWPRGARVSRRALAAVLAAPIVIGTAAATWAGDAGSSAPHVVVPASGAAVVVRAARAPKRGTDAAPSAIDAARASEQVAPLASGRDVPHELGLHEPLRDREPSRDDERSRTVRRLGGRHGVDAVDPAALERRALEAFVAGREREAIGVYQRATEIAPARASAWRGLGLAASAAGDHETAARALRRYLELAPSARDRREIEQRLAAR